VKHAAINLKMSHTRFLYHIVFRTKGGAATIDASWERELYKYLGGIVKGWKGTPIAINGMPDHVHLLVLMTPCDFAAFMRELKAYSSKWAKRHDPNFAWQRRYGAFTVSSSVADRVREYIENQKAHHAERTFESEYVELLTRHGVEFDREYLWD
jgi:REP element-mobilizing transposase RayT